jgi:hypothetical protein
MEACYGGTDVMERSCAVARGIDINTKLSYCTPPDEGRFVPEGEPRRAKIAPLGKSVLPRAAHILAQSGYFSS